MPLFQSLINKCKGSNTKISDDAFAARPLDERDIYRYRRQYGVNLGE
jgi:hypothetical protein